MTRMISTDALSELVGEPIEVFLGRLDLKLPSIIDAEPVRHGRWIFTGRIGLNGGIEVKCSQCENLLMIQNIEHEKYCCFCGSRMDEE